MRERKFTEDFGCMYRVKEYFSELDNQIKKFGEDNEKNPAVQNLKKKREELFWVVREINRTDLQFLYYLHKLEQVKPHRMLSSLRKMYEAQEEVFALCGKDCEE